MGGETCFICGTAQADRTRLLVVGMRRKVDFTQCMVPSCAACREKEAVSWGRRQPGLALGIVLLIAVLGALIGGLRVGMVAFFVAVIVAMVVETFVVGRGKIAQYPAVMELEKQGWRIDRVYQVASIDTSSQSCGIPGIKPS